MNTKTLVNELNNKFEKDCSVLKVPQPWFGYFKLKTDNNELKYYVGRVKSVDHKIIDKWNPIAEAYYYDVGDDFELENMRGMRKEDKYYELEGIVDQKAKVIADKRKIKQLFFENIDGKQTFVLNNDDEYSEVGDIAKNYYSAETGGLPDILALLTKEQYKLITTGTQLPLIIQGSAGSGKTSVALYRISYLTEPKEDSSLPPINPSNVLYVMFNKALCTFVQGTMKQHGLEDVVVNTFHGWALDEIKKAYKGNIEVSTKKIEGKNASSEIKKQVGILAA